MKILYLDDNEEVLQNAVIRLEKKAHSVHTARTIEEARDCLANPDLKIDLVIADHNLDQVGCLDFLMGIPQAYEKTKVCIVSHSITRSEENQLKMTEIPYFRKPVLYDSVLAKFKKVPPVVRRTVIQQPGIAPSSSN